MTDGEWVRKGAEVVAYHDRTYMPTALGEPTTIINVLPTMIVTADGKRYRRGDRVYLISAGRYGGTTLMPVTDPRVRAVMAHDELVKVAKLAENLKNLPVHDTAEVHDRLRRLGWRVAQAAARAAELADSVEGR